MVIYHVSVICISTWWI